MKEEIGKPNDLVPLALLRAMDQFYGIEHQSEPEMLYSFCAEGKSSPKRKKPLRILYATFLRYPNVGGLASYITSIKTGFERIGHQADVISPLQMPPSFFQEDIPRAADEIRAFLVGRYGAANEKFLKNLSYLHVFQRFLKEKDLEQYDLFHAQDLFAVFLLGYLNQTYQRPLFFTPHGHFTKSRMKFHKIQKGSIEEAYFSEIERQGIRASDKIITISDSFHEPLLEYGAKEAQLTTVHTGIDIQDAPESKRAEKLVIACVSRLTERKGHDVMLDALARIRHHLSGVDIWIIGDGNMRGFLEEKRRKLGLSNVFFLGKRRDVPALLAESSIFVLPTLNDNFPIAIIEAMFSGQAIVATDCGGIPEMIRHEATGLICQPGNSRELADALVMLITDQSLRERLGKEARSYAGRHLRQELMVSKIESIYQSFF
ncbi:glycosyltransferase family 4 protein [Bacillus velezensis]|uniref:glycosyltransferase family 4 protein n=1 Tax=Bacillus velezensis TaxID=492670 RepID=UPI001CCCB010|nr:glycosyltransferase family 4 protein [Bacillus velezensis]UBM13081.1 glycosyltransferase family 4 protein [Bacillus velezensis]